MKAFAWDKTVRLGAEGLVLWAEIHNEGDVNVVVLKCHGVDHSKSSNFFLPPLMNSVLSSPLHEASPLQTFHPDWSIFGRFAAHPVMHTNRG